MSLAEPFNVAAGLRYGARVYPDRLALAQGEYRATYGELNRYASRVANAMAGLGIAPGRVVGVVLPNVSEYLEVIFGLAKAGVVAATMNPRSTPHEIGYILEDADCQAVIVHADLAPVVEAALSEVGRSLPSARKVVVGGAVGGWSPYRDWLAQASDQDPMLPVGDEAIYTVPYTSGTTGRPKGVTLSHRSRGTLMLAMALEYKYAQDSRNLAVAPLYHGAGLAFGVTPILVGGTTHVLRKFDPEETLALIAREQITEFFMVPTMFHAIFALGSAPLSRHDVSAVRTIVSNAAPLPHATKGKILEYWRNAGLHETYGSTEGGIVTNLRPSDQLRKVTCVGQPFLFTDVKLLSEDGQEVPVGTVGELFSRSPFLFSGYLGRPEETAAAICDGYFSAGDLARMDEEGHFFIVDRKKDMVISGGVNIYPREIEEVLHTHPAVREAAVIGVPDDYWGEALKAVVALRPDAPATADQLMAFCRERLAGYKVPRSFEFVPDLPRSAAGKILKRDLRELFSVRTGSAE